MSLCILISFGLFPVSRGVEQLDYSVLFASLSILSIMIAPLISTIQMLPALVQGHVSLKRVLEVLHRKNPLPAQRCPEGADQGSSQNPGSEECSDKPILQWKSDRTIWNDCDIPLEPGERVVLSGPSGSGKSLIIHSMLRTAWEAFRSGAGLVRGSGISYCDQTPWFFPQMSIRDNITFGSDMREDLYNSTIVCCCLCHDILSLPDGHDSIISDSSGAILSGGQRKRIALARALYNEPMVLILDDVFAGLDSMTQAAIEKNLFGEHGYLSQRPSTIVILASTKGTRPPRAQISLSWP